MTETIQQRVLETIERHSMIRPGDRVGLGVSGGADSVALLRLFTELRTKLGVTIFVLHFNHQLRGPEADADERFVQELASASGVEFACGRADVAGEAHRNGWNLEDAARRLRYEFFESIAVARDLGRVAVAHTADDQAETVLSHLLRGTGLTGLAGIYPVSGRIFRPLLEIGRGEMRDYLSCLGQGWREDATNKDTSRMRARIRHRLVPLLSRDFGSSTVTRLARLASLAREEEGFWRALEDDRLTELTTREPSGAISAAVADMLSPFSPQLVHEGSANRSIELPADSTLILTRRLVRRIYGELRGSRRQLTARHVQSVLDLATKSHSGARIELPGILVQRSFDRLIFSIASEASRPNRNPKSHDKNNLRAHGFEYAISPPPREEHAYIVVPEIGRRFSLKVVDWPTGSRETNGSRGILDFGGLRWPVILRNWRPGDSYRPAGRKRTRKLNRLFLESRIPLSTRAGWPVLTSNEQLVWAAGYPVAEGFAPSSDTQTALVIAEEEFQV